MRFISQSDYRNEATFVHIVIDTHVSRISQTSPGVLDFQKSFHSYICHNKSIHFA